MKPEIKEELLTLLATASQETWDFLVMVANRAEAGSRGSRLHDEFVAFRIFVYNHHAPHNRLPLREKIDADFDANLEKLREPVAEVVQQVDEHLDELNASEYVDVDVYNYCGSWWFRYNDGTTRITGAPCIRGFMGYVVNGERLETMPLPVPTDDKGRAVMKLRFRKGGA